MAAAESGTELVKVVVLLAAGVIAVPLFKRLGLGSVLGYLAAGLAIGPFGLGFFSDAQTILHVAELGVVLLLFEIGLDTDLRAMFRVGSAALSVAAVGVLLPLAFGFAYWAYLPHPAASSASSLTTAAIFVVRNPVSTGGLSLLVSIAT